MLSCGLGPICSLSIEVDGVAFAHIMEKFVIRSGARVSAAKQRNGRLCARPATPKGPSETLADEIPRVEVDIR